MKYNVLFCSALVSFLPFSVFAAGSVSDLPNISAVGNFMGTMQSHQAPQFHVQEIELGIQHYAYPGVHADIFTSLHQENNGDTTVDLEEAYLTFSDLFGTLAPDAGLPVIESIAGLKKLPIGKWNSMHSEQWPFADAPLTQQLLLGGEEGLAGQGIQFSSDLPVPFFSRLTVGEWRLPDHPAENGPSYGSPFLGVRSWNSVAISDDLELELGLNGYSGNATSPELARQSLIGVDLTATQELGNKQFIKGVGEWFRVDYARADADSRQPQYGSSLTTYYQPNGNYQFGARYDWVGHPTPDEPDQTLLALFATRMLTDTAKLRLQTNFDQDQNLTVFIQFLCVLGPHSHAIQ